MFEQLTFHPVLERSGFALELNSSRVPVAFRESKRARQYVIYVRRDGTIMVTIPQRGTARGAKQFLESRRDWITRVLQRLRNRPAAPAVWQDGTEVLFRGNRVPIRVAPHGHGLAVYLGNELCGLAAERDNFRALVERRLQKIAVLELPPRVQELATQHQAPVRRITVRNQRSRWGSCSRRGTISLNWRLVQVPAEVRDYIILHELMHLRQMNHSRRFWAEVALVCPSYRECERWLKAHGSILGL
jgi:predicted metal-dependent hydrolase